MTREIPKRKKTMNLMDMDFLSRYGAINITGNTKIKLGLISIKKPYINPI